MSNWIPPMIPAVYSISYKQDPVNKPKAHTVLFFGEASDLSQDSLSISTIMNEIQDTDIRLSDLFVFIHAMPNTSKYERSKVMQNLICEYLPIGNGY
ncbi:MAG TPA: hypothetical protein V6C81_08795 [Planktothrix sp.]